MRLMAHTPQHPDNPCSLDENEETPAKIWELLRRNNDFQTQAQRLRELDEQARPETERHHRLGSQLNQALAALAEAREQKAPAETIERLSVRRGALNQEYDSIRQRPIWTQSCALIAEVRKHHEFGGHALQWLVPQPEFRVWRVTLPKNLDLKVEGEFIYDSVAEGCGTTPDPDDHEHWSWEKRSKGQLPGAVGGSSRRGPIIFWQTSDAPRLCSRFNAIQEWRDYFANDRKFTVDTPWREAPPEFRRTFCRLWRQRDSHALSPETGLRHDAPEPHETDFFQDWHLVSALAHAKAQKLEHEDMARAFMFDDLARNYRVFAFPKAIRTRTEARRMKDWLFEQLSRSPDGSKLPKAPEIFGTPIQWDVFLFAGQCNDTRLWEAYKQAKPQVKPTERKQKWQKERLNYIEHFRAIDHEIARIFSVKPQAVKSPSHG